MVTDVIFNSKIEIITFFIMFIFILICFSIWGYVAFGDTHKRFSTVGRGISMLISMLRDNAMQRSKGEASIKEFLFYWIFMVIA